jgi:pfkB family carbohydrate kinase
MRVVMADVVCFGDLLIDFVPTVTGKGLADAPAFVKAPGGAAANVAVGLVRLGASSAFVGKVGEDPFGHFLADTLAREGVDVRALRFETRARTALAFVSLRADGEREFLFYRHPSADMLFRPDEVDAATVAACRFGGPSRRCSSWRKVWIRPRSLRIRWFSSFSSSSLSARSRAFSQRAFRSRSVSSPTVPPIRTNVTSAMVWPGSGQSKRL